MRRRTERDVELAAVRVGPAVGHRQHAPVVVTEDEVLVGERITVDAPAAGAVPAIKVPALHHEALDDPMEGGIEVSVSIPAGSLLLLEQSQKVVRRFRHDVGRHEEPQCAQLLRTVRERQIRPL